MTLHERIWEFARVNEIAEHILILTHEQDPCDRHSGISFSQARGKLETTYEHDNNRQWKGVSPPISREAVDWVSIRSVQSLWPHIALVIHESAIQIQHSDSITACS